MDAEQVISGQLEPGERLLWAGAPKQGWALRGSDAFMIPFSLMWGGFAIFWETMVVRHEGPGFMVLWGVPFVLVGLYMIAGRFLVDNRARSRTFYGVTDRRAIIVSGLFTRNVKSVSLRTLSDLAVSERGDGSGSITFGPSPPWGLRYSGMGWSGVGSYLPPCFELITDAKRVYNVIRQAQEGK